MAKNIRPSDSSGYDDPFFSDSFHRWLAFAGVAVNAITGCLYYFKELPHPDRPALLIAAGILALLPAALRLHPNVRRLTAGSSVSYLLITIFLAGAGGLTYSVSNSFNIQAQQQQFLSMEPIIEALMKDPAKTVDYRVKAALLYLFGDNNPDPSTVPSSNSVSTYINDPAMYFRLAKYLNLIAGSCFATPKNISPSAARGAKKVQDCIDLVNKSGAISAGGQ